MRPFFTFFAQNIIPILIKKHLEKFIFFTINPYFSSTYEEYFILYMKHIVELPSTMCNMMYK